VTFNSVLFLFFLPCVLVLYALVCTRESLRDWLLLCASYYFYMCWSWPYAGLLLLSTTIDYWVGIGLQTVESPRARKALMVASVTVNLAILGTFKYFNFFADLTAMAGHRLGLAVPTVHHQLILPIAISFYTFHELSYIIDVYHRRIDCERRFVKYALFVVFFPQLVAGPILRASHFIPQLHRRPALSQARATRGFALIFRGLTKKIVLADMLAGFGVDAVFARPAAYSSLDLVMAIYGYSFQIYNDFSGYSDIAIGTACILGFDLNENFNRPYLAQGIREFWTRWHISLSTWLRDYLYIPLGGNRQGIWRQRANLMITMLLGGLWHGAAINFVLWGGWHGLLLCLARQRHRPEARSWLVIWRRRLLCFHLVAFSWLLFRIRTAPDLATYLGGLTRMTGGTALPALFYGILAAAFVSHFLSQAWIERLGRSWLEVPRPLQAVAYAMLLVAFSGLTVGAPSFIYFEF
jgi:D-alanyl-lipoteichoic acid acyltransferase DltB (MBOAT superfamily)